MLIIKGRRCVCGNDIDQARQNLLNHIPTYFCSITYWDTIVKLYNILQQQHVGMVFAMQYFVAHHDLYIMP